MMSFKMSPSTREIPYIYAFLRASKEGKATPDSKPRLFLHGCRGDIPILAPAALNGSSLNDTKIGLHTGDSGKIKWRHVWSLKAVFF